MYTHTVIFIMLRQKFTIPFNSLERQDQFIFQFLNPKWTEFRLNRYNFFISKWTEISNWNFARIYMNHLFLPKINFENFRFIFEVLFPSIFHECMPESDFRLPVIYFFFFFQLAWKSNFVFVLCALGAQS